MPSKKEAKEAKEVCKNIAELAEAGKVPKGYFVDLGPDVFAIKAVALKNKNVYEVELSSSKSIKTTYDGSHRVFLKKSDMSLKDAVQANVDNLEHQRSLNEQQELPSRKRSDAKAGASKADHGTPLDSATIDDLLGDDD